MQELSNKSSNKRKKTPESRNPESRLNYLTSLAVDEAEKRLKNGTASTQLLTKLIDYGTTKAKMELKKMMMDLEVSNAKINQMQLQQTSSELYEEALKAFANYRGENSKDSFSDEDY